MEEAFIFVNIIEKNMYICILSDITFTFYLSTCKSYTMSVKSLCKYYIVFSPKMT